MEAASNPTLTRRRQRRPDLQSTFDIPADLHTLISRVAQKLQSETADPSAHSTKVVRATDAALQELLQPALTPEQQLHAISKITGAVKDFPKSQLRGALTDAAGVLHAWSRTLALEAVVPLLLDCRVRYLHRALMTLLRTVLPGPVDAAAAETARGLYVTRVLRCHTTATSSGDNNKSSSSSKDAAAAASSSLPTAHGTPTLFPYRVATDAASAAALYFPGDRFNAEGNTADIDPDEESVARDTVLNFLNSIDGLTSTLMPLMPSIFQDTFLEVLPLLADCFQWVVANATRHCRSQVSNRADPVPGENNTTAEANNAEEEEAMAGGREKPPRPPQQESGAGTVFGEDLEHIRFCVRVIATYVHKYMDFLTAAIAAGVTNMDVSRQLAALLQPAVVMLSSPIFPKDVLNAVGLLVASILTVRTCDGWLLGAVCAALQGDVTRSALAATASSGADDAATCTTSAAAAPLSTLFADAEAMLRVVCAADPQAAAHVQGGAGAQAVYALFESFTPNGCFALLKGILAHTSSPIRGDWLTLGVLLTPQQPEGNANGIDKEEEASAVVAYDSILPTAQQYCNMVQEPETRFMAIQTVDSVVRYVNAVLRTAAKALKQESQPATASLTAAERRHLASLCVSSAKLQKTLAFATQLIMALWDDGTQQMSGALYTTYNEILEINATLQSCATATATTEKTLNDGGVVVDTAVTLHQILDVQAERRGKYHALLGLLSMMPLEEFLSVLQTHYGGSEPSVAGAVARFSRTLISGASNHKIANVAGDVFAQLAKATKGACDRASQETREGRKDDEPVTADQLLHDGIVVPLARAILEPGYVSVSSNVSEAVNISHITAHFVPPLIKQDPTLLKAILAAVVAHHDDPHHHHHRHHTHQAVPPAPTASSSHEWERMEQGVVEVLTRARGVGVDIVPFLAPGSTVLRVLEESTHSLNYDVRNAALCLCVLSSKKVQAVQPWQMQKVEEYLILNMHLGGDSTARKGLLEMVKKWVRRLTESYTSKGAGAADSTVGVQGSGKTRKAAAKKREEEAKDPLCAAGNVARTDVASTVLELGTSAYRQTVLAHCTELASIFAQNIGVTVRAGLGLAVERRVAAMMSYAILLHGLRPLVKDNVIGVRMELTDSAVAAKDVFNFSKEASSQRRPLLHIGTVPALIATLCDGWSQARSSARELLRLFCDVAPTEVFREVTQHSDGTDAALASLVERAHQDLLHAQTYRNAEGAVQRFLLFTTHTAEAQAAAQHHPQQELHRLCQLLELEQESVDAKCAAMSAMHGRQSYAYIQANPLHGSLSLCSELLGVMASVERRLTPSLASGNTSTDTVEVPRAPLTQACTHLLTCCCVVLRTCSSLVGTETVMSGATAVLSESEVVDCRGHVYDRSRPEAESVMRGVVNNTWLSMRVATSAIDRILRVRPVHELPFDEVRTAAYGLVHALLLTKHNGVMRCVREALKALSATLVRSRQTQFYQLPAELLSFLLGPEGVTSGDMGRMLRRSQGLPHAILAVLEAEDTAVPYCLFPIAMRQLLRVARGDGTLGSVGVVGPAHNLGSTADDVRRAQRSNALNVMKFVFEDKVFADRVVAYIEEAFSLATEGFHDASWYTRNSSLMLFSAVIHRFVGEHPSTGGSGVNTSLHDVAKRTPRGVAYAYAELTRDNGLVDSDAAAEDANPAEVNVALFPVLQLLSMLSPDPPHLLTKVSHGEWDDSARMTAAVMQCAGSPSLMVRSASAVALCCLVPIASLPATIKETQRQLSMQPPATVTETPIRENTKKTCTPRGDGLNGCHGALLQLLQFHAQYVGTLRRHYKQRRSSYATPIIAQSVCHAIVEVLLSCEAVLMRACAVCPTVAAAVFALLADLVFYSPQQRLGVKRQRALHTFGVAALHAYMSAHHGVLERGSVLEGASAMMVFLAVQECKRDAVDGVVHDVSAASQQVKQVQIIQAVLQREAQDLSIHRGEHNLVSWIMAQLVYYRDDRGTLSPDEVAAAVRVLTHEWRCDISNLALHSLTTLFEGEAEGAAAQAVTASLDCIAWGQLVTHLRFAATTMPPYARSNLSDGVSELYATLVRLLTPPSLSSSSLARSVDKAPLHNSDACSAALDFITHYDMCATTPAVSSPVANILSFYAAPEQPLESRLAVVKALRTAQSFLHAAVTAVTAGAACPPSATTLLLALFRLLVDDMSDIREAASVICSSCVWSAQAAARDQVSCLLAVVRLLRQLHATGQVQSAKDVVQSILALTGEEEGGSATAAAAASATPAPEEEEDDESTSDNDDGGVADDVLFQKESANMFAEETVLQYVVGRIFGTGGSPAVAEACRSFAVYDRLLT